MIEGIVYSLYSFLAYAEVLVLIASAIALFAFLAWQLFKKIRSLTDAAITAVSPSAESDLETLNPASATAGKRSRVISGAHNERF